MGSPRKQAKRPLHEQKSLLLKNKSQQAPLPPQTKVKVETVAKRRVFTEDEDISICKAWVNISEDPVVGADQKKDQFWARVHQKMYQIYNEDVEVKS